MSDDDALDSDEQGERGQAEFRAICIDVKLTANEAGRDRAGYDFAVNARIDADSPPGLDARQAPLSCLVQVKTLKSHNDRIKLRLSSVEQIAKDLKPTFIYVFKRNDDGSFANSYLIHLLDENLGKVLEKLRSERAAGRFAVNNAYLYMYASKVGIEIAPTGQALKRKLEELCGSDPASYIAKKTEQLQKLGYEGAPYKLTTTLKLASIEEFTDVLLGLKANVPATITDRSETRFNIEIKDDEIPAEGEISITPKPTSGCRVILRRDRYATPVSLSGLVYTAPRIDDFTKVGAIAARCDLIDVICKIDDKKLNLTLKTPPISSETRMSPQQWLNYFKIAQAVSTDGFSLEIRSDQGAPLVLKDLKKLRELDDTVISFDIGATKMLSDVLEMAGISGDIHVSYDEIIQQHSLTQSAYLIMNNDPDMTPLSFDAEVDENIDISHISKGVHVNYITIAGVMYAWSADVKLKNARNGKLVSFSSISVDFREIRSFNPHEYRVYVSTLAKADPDAVIMSRDLDVGIDSEELPPPPG